MAPGVYSYKFQVDGKYVIDQNAPFAMGPLGNDDNIIEVVPAIMEHSIKYDDIKQELDEIPINFAKNQKNAIFVKITTSMEGPLKIKGSWDDWTSLYPMKSKYYQALNKPENVINFLLNPGIYEYKYFVNNSQLIHDSNQLSRPDNYGGFNNYFKVIEKHLDTNPEGRFTPEKVNWDKIDVEELNFSPIQGHSISLIGEEFYIFGGFYRQKFIDTLRCVNKENLQIEQPYTTGRMPEPRAYHRFIHKLIT